MNFASDNWTVAAPEILDAIARANAGAAPAYGGDAYTATIEKRFSDLFERDCAVFFVATGGAANGLALSVMTPPYGMILCHEQSHVQMDECGGPEFFTGGAKLLPIAGAAGKITPAAIEKVLSGFPERPPHGMPATVLSLTQGTECGTLYSVDELTALSKTAKNNGLRVHLDGARFANAMAAIGASPAEMSWRAGVDAMSFGATKNGCLAAEAVVFFEPSLAKDFAFRRKRSGHLLSKMRFIAAQFDAYFEEGRWLRWARHANEMAQRLSSSLAAIQGVEISYPTEINEVFVVFPEGVAEKLRAAGAQFYPWVTPGDPADGKMQRLITSYATTPEEIEHFAALTGKLIERP